MDLSIQYNTIQYNFIVHTWDEVSLNVRARGSCIQRRTKIKIHLSSSSMKFVHQQNFDSSNSVKNVPGKQAVIRCRKIVL